MSTRGENAHATARHSPDDASEVHDPRHDDSAADTLPNKHSLEEDPDLTSLKHRLLGPSLTKAGQDAVDQRKVSEIIFNASKGSKFFANEQARDRALTAKIERLVAQKENILRDPDLVAHETRKADALLMELEQDSRDLTQIIVHVDCDAFYAAVEQRDRPELKSVPFGVGKGVITTCNYEARKWGVRSAMAGFVAMKLCPTLTLIPLNFSKYQAAAEQVRAVLVKYDENFEPASVDEAFLNITEYCAANTMTGEAAVSQLRAQVSDECKITVSAGIAPNAKLAKLASNMNKPDGQYVVPCDSVESVLGFIHSIPVRKVNGIGRVLERQLTDVLGISIVQDLFQHRGLLAPLFGEKAATFLLQTYLGLGRTEIAPGDGSDRKSVGTERTFHELQGKEELRKKLGDIAAELEEDMRKVGVKGRTVVLKVKLHTYEVLTRQTAVTGSPVSTAEELERVAAPMLAKLEKEHQVTGFRLRLMGLRCTGLVDAQKAEIPSDFFGKATAKQPSWETERKVKTDRNGWQIWPETEFESAERREREAAAEEMEKWSQEYESSQKGQKQESPAIKLDVSKEQDVVLCPVCLRPQPADDTTLNAHIDHCLSLQTIGEIVREAKAIDTTPNPLADAAPNINRKKRGRPKSGLEGAGNGSVVQQDSKRNVRIKQDFFTVRTKP